MQILVYVLVAVLVAAGVAVAVAASLVIGALAVAAAALVGGGRVLGELGRSAIEVLGANASTAHLHGFAPPLADEPGRDPGYRSYLLGPVLQDLRELTIDAADEAWSRTMGVSDERALVRQIFDEWSTGLPSSGQVFLFPSLIGAEAGAIAGFGAGAVVLLAVLVVFTVFVGVAAAFAGLGMVLLRMLEIVVLRVRGISVECGNCHRRVGSPAYDCPDCDAARRSRHRRLVPGRLGVLWRTCRCGNRLPTLLLLGKWRLTAYCQHNGCNHALPARGLTTPTFHVPMVAGTLAGKTVFMLATVADLEAAAGPDGLEFADETRAEEIQRMLTAIRTDGVDGVQKTLPDQPLRPLTLYLGARRRKLLYLYDAAGEGYEQGERLEVMRFLEFTAGVVFVVDPFALPAVQRAVDTAVLEGARPSATDPTTAAEGFTAGLRARLGLSARRKIQVAAALVVTKCDALLVDPSVRHPYDDLGAEPTGRDGRSAAVRAWLGELGADQIVAHLDSCYRRTGFFAVSGLDPFEGAERTSARTGAEVRNDDPAAPVRWLLDPEELP